MIKTALRSLESYSLVQWKSEQGSYSVQKLIHTWVHDRIDEERGVDVVDSANARVGTWVSTALTMGQVADETA
jgi:hypothetical protein